ncbi:MAG: DUF4282 domain-containing protein [Propioniciclava sp.]|uniref:DUF4282 domain-containing protein n=1 Tax=Propioniciclava sp. TaxID=2038686 RepID=UPI0039E5ECB9
MTNADNPERPDQSWQPPTGDPVPPFAAPSDSPWPSPAESANPYGAPTPPYSAPQAYGDPQQPYTDPQQADQPPQSYGQAPYAPYGAGSVPPPQAPPTWAAPPMPPSRHDANPLAALFDFGFTKFATPGIVKVVYILSVVGAVLVWVMAIISGFGAGRYAGGPAMGVVALLFGWIPALLFIAYMRFILEAIVALIRIHDRVDEIASRRDGDFRQR